MLAVAKDDRGWDCKSVGSLTGRETWGTSVQSSRSVVSDSATPWAAARQASLSITNSRSLPKQECVHWVSDAIQPSHPLSSLFLLPPSIFPSIRGFSNESALHIRRPKSWSFSFSISPSWKDTGHYNLAEGHVLRGGVASRAVSECGFCGMDVNGPFLIKTSRVLIL